jgi:hypothetical protein
MHRIAFIDGLVAMLDVLATGTGTDDDSPEAFAQAAIDRLPK